MRVLAAAGAVPPHTAARRFPPTHRLGVAAGCVAATPLVHSDPPVCRYRVALPQFVAQRNHLGARDHSDFTAPRLGATPESSANTSTRTCTVTARSYFVRDIASYFAPTAEKFATFLRPA